MWHQIWLERDAKVGHMDPLKTRLSSAELTRLQRFHSSFQLLKEPKIKYTSNSACFRSLWLFSYSALVQTDSTHVIILSAWANTEYFTV